MADEIRPTPRNPLFGLFSDFVNVPLDYMSDPRRTQQMQGIASFIRGTGVPSTLENLSYDPSGRGLFTGAGGLGGTTRMRPEAIDAALTLAPGVGPAVRMTKGLPVGASIKPINLSKGIFNPEITMQEMLRVREIPTVERVQRSIDLVGEKKFQEMVESQFKQYKPTNQTQEAMLVESVTLDILGRANRDPKLLRGLPGLKIPAPQQAALDLAQQRAALPVEQGGLGLPANNTPKMRAQAMRFDVEAYRGSTAKEISHTNPIWWTEDPSYANTYAAHIVRPPIGQPDPYSGNVMPLLVKIGNEKQFEKFNAGGVPLDPFSGFSSDMQTGLRRYPKNDLTGELGGKVWEAVSIPENVRSRFAAFDPFRRSAAVAATMGAAAPDLLASPMYTDPFGNTIADTTR